MRRLEYLAAPIMLFLGLSHLDEFLGSQPLLSLGFLHSTVAAKMLTGHKQTASNIPSLEAFLEITQSKPSSKLDHPGQGAQDLAQLSLEFLQWHQLQNLPGQPQDRCSSYPSSEPFPALPPACPCPAAVGSPELGTALPLKSHQCWAKGNNHLWLPSSAPPNAARMLLSLSAHTDVHRYNRILRTLWIMYFQGLLCIREIQMILFC